jgi:hypothetical protein
LALAATERSIAGLKSNFAGEFSGRSNRAAETGARRPIGWRMDAFSYLSVLISIVLGLGLTSLLAGFAAMVRCRRRLVMYWPLPAQMSLLFLVHVQVWWALFALRQRSHWSFPDFLVVLLQPVLLYLATAFLIPDLRDDQPVDLRQAYFRESRWYFAALLLSIFDSLAKNLVLTWRFQSGTDLLGHAAFIGLSVAGLVSRNDLVHKTIAPLSIVVYVAYIALLFVSMPG